MNFNTMGFKIARVGTTLTYSARGWDGLSWTTWTTIDTATVAAGDATVAFGVQNSTSTSVGTNWDNFVAVTTPVPEPASLALLGLGALGLLRRRR